MNHYLAYPISRCHVCDHIMIYQNYDNGEKIAHCNNPAMSCMTFRYNVMGNVVCVKGFKIGKDGWLLTDTQCIEPSGTVSKHTADIEPNSIMNKAFVLKLLSNLPCST